jgi:hypothetical protein
VCSNGPLGRITNVSEEEKDDLVDDLPLMVRICYGQQRLLDEDLLGASEGDGGLEGDFSKALSATSSNEAAVKGQEGQSQA